MGQHDNFITTLNVVLAKIMVHRPSQQHPLTKHLIYLFIYLPPHKFIRTFTYIDSRNEQDEISLSHFYSHKCVLSLRRDIL